ncbi:hypothetical protein Aeqsu_3138 [Aequorivita sublithincola DSM 14238]|uniref:Uncharacterized protein n=1 Tax=Aequorivita sublithincola (strain DSM 14238 / LMG 21431 / ACAM 643 / 9-3) TaxID=746697 RepID=I3Z005_AEQSU|nr:hypothetical protein [Aequorivita sublithincola]AFL82573.1 hypothetical protein Aeqsu_3138 [Aequorivita sublithincola DSM 14238]
MSKQDSENNNPAKTSTKHPTGSTSVHSEKDNSTEDGFKPNASRNKKEEE